MEHWLDEHTQRSDCLLVALDHLHNRLLLLLREEQVFLAGDEGVLFSRHFDSLVGVFLEMLHREDGVDVIAEENVVHEAFALLVLLHKRGELEVGELELEHRQHPSELCLRDYSLP